MTSIIKSLTLAFLNFIVLTGIAQISNETNECFDYQLYFNLSCENEIVKADWLYINTYINDSAVVFYSDSNGVCRIPKSDTVVLYVHANYGTNRTVIYSGQDSEIDTVTIPPIYTAPIKPSGIGPTYYGWYNCGQLCHGNCKSFRLSGEIWQKGKFKRGKLKKLIVYDTNGQVESKTKDGVVVSYGIISDNLGKMKVKYRKVFFFESYKVYDSASDKYIRKKKYLKSQ